MQRQGSLNQLSQQNLGELPEDQSLNEANDSMKFQNKMYSLVQTPEQTKLIQERIDKNPKNFSPYDFDALHKIVLIGESNTGKTSMLVRFIENHFNDKHLCTIGVDFKIKTLRVDDKIIKLQIWDTAGQERFRSISHAYYRNSHGCVAVYDITNRASFDLVEEQIRNFMMYNHRESNQNIILVGNKSDLNDKCRKVSFQEAVELAKRLELAAVFEVSAMDNIKIDDVFSRAVVNCVDQFSTSLQQQNDSESNYSSRNSKSNSNNYSIFGKSRVSGDAQSDIRNRFSQMYQRPFKFGRSGMYESEYSAQAQNRNQLASSGISSIRHQQQPLNQDQALSQSDISSNKLNPYYKKALFPPEQAQNNSGMWGLGSGHKPNMKLVQQEKIGYLYPRRQRNCC